MSRNEVGQRLREIEERVSKPASWQFPITFSQSDVSFLLTLLSERDEENRQLREAWLTERAQVLWLGGITEHRPPWAQVPDYEKQRYREQAEHGLAALRGDSQ